MQRTLEEQWQPYARLVSFDTLAERIRFASSRLHEDVLFLVPSVSLAKDGPVVQALFLVTENYLCEVRINQNIQDFDVSLVTTIKNYRIEIAQQEIASEEPDSGTKPTTEKRVDKMTYDTATIHLVHSFGSGTRITYVGPGRDGWIEHVFNALPIGILGKSRGE